MIKEMEREKGLGMAGRRMSEERCFGKNRRGQQRGVENRIKGMGGGNWNVGKKRRGMGGWEKRGQQEMVGFVLIVVIVVIGLLVFLLFSVRPGDVKENDIANNLLSAIMKTSSECAIVYEPNYDDMRDLFRSCYDGRRCANTQEMACKTLEVALETILDEVLILEPIIEAYQLDFSHSDSIGFESYLHLVNGNCTGNLYGSEPQTIRISSNENLLVSLRICMPSNL